ncbi:MAG: NAD-dependent deacetylase [Proteobacteria bacterium]|nr:NAD-dependent deacetylase [Pseudomonadota bacterium]
MRPKKRVIFLTGAGLSAPSGLQTFRGKDGLWMGHRIDEVCNELTYNKNRDKVFAFYNARRQELATAAPNAAHALIAELQADFGTKAVLNVTQNVDDLLERAGVTDVLHVHGFLPSLQCTRCNGFSWDIGHRAAQYGADTCPNCNRPNAVKPNIVLFGGMAPKYRTMYKLFSELTEDDLVVVIGTTGAVIPVNDLLTGGVAFYGMGARCKALLCLMEPSMYIREDLFGTVIYGCCAENASAIGATVRAHLNGD